MTLSTAIRTRNVVSALNQLGLKGIIIGGVKCAKVEEEWQVLDSPAPESPSETEMHLHYVAMAYSSSEAAQDALRELIVREPVDLVERQAYWEAMRDQAEVIYEFLGLK